MLAPPVDLDLEVAGAHADATRELGRHAPRRSARTRPRPGPTWRGPPARAAGCGRARRGPAGGRNGRRRRGGDRRRGGGGRARPRDARARRRSGGRAGDGARRRRRRANRRGWSRRGRSRSRWPGPRPGPPCPRCRSAGGRRARRRRGPCRRGGSGSPSGGAAATPGQPSSDACGSQSNVSVSPVRRTTFASGRQEGEERVEQRRLADLALFRGDDHRDAGLDEEPERGGQLGVEGALADQRDDRAFGGRVGHVPEPTAPGQAAAAPSARLVASVGECPVPVGIGPILVHGPRGRHRRLPGMIAKSPLLRLRRRWVVLPSSSW